MQISIWYYVNNAKPDQLAVALQDLTLGRGGVDFVTGGLEGSCV